MIVGIDLGTSTSEIAYLKAGKPMMIRDISGTPQRNGKLPSVVAYDGQLRVGEHAENLLTLKPAFAVEEVKRLMGTDQRVTLAGKEYSPQEISALILRHLKEEAEKYLGEPVTEAVITVPAYFNVLQRRATKDAAELAGLTVKRLINEPTAAALAYGIERPQVEEKVLVYDLGGGTLDVTVLELSEGILDVLASSGNSELGGKDFDELLLEHLRQECRRATGLDLLSVSPETQRLRHKARLKAAAKRAKEELSAVESTQIVLDNLGLAPDGSPIDFEYTLTREVFSDLIRDLVESTREQLDEVLAAKEVLPEAIDAVVLVGGSTRVPFVREFVSRYFGGRELRTEVNPDEAVALGAAILSGMESRVIDPHDLVITDVSAFTLGVGVVAQYEGQWRSNTFDPLIQRNQTIPRTARKSYSTLFDGQESVHVDVYQGEAPLCENNTKVGELELEISPVGPAGQPVEIEFSYDLSGDLEVVARDLRSGREVRASMQPMPERLSDAERIDARARLEQVWAGPPEFEAPPNSSMPGEEQQQTEAWKQSKLYPQVAALIDHAEKRLPGLSPEVAARVHHLLNEIKAALQRGDQVRLAGNEEALTDLLFDLT